jgi:hypothetical protein
MGDRQLAHLRQQQLPVVTLAGIFAANQLAQLAKQGGNLYDRYAPLAKRLKGRFDKHLAKRKQNQLAGPSKAKNTQGSSMPRYGRKRSGKGARKGTAKRRRQTTKKFKKAKRTRNYKYLKKTKIPLGGLTERKVIRLIGVDCIPIQTASISTTSGTHTDMTLDDIGDVEGGTGALTPIQYRTFCLNDLARWRTYLYKMDEFPTEPTDSSAGYVPGWDLWKDKYLNYEIIGANVKIQYTNNAGVTGGNCVVGYNITHSRIKGGEIGLDPTTKRYYDPNTLHSALTALDNAHKVNTSEDLIRSKLFTNKTIIAESPGNRAFFKTSFSTRKAYPSAGSNEFDTKAFINASMEQSIGEPHGPSRPMNRTYLTCAIAPTLSSTEIKCEMKIEVEWIVVMSGLRQQFKTTQQHVNDSFSYEATIDE